MSRCLLRLSLCRSIASANIRNMQLAAIVSFSVRPALQHLLTTKWYGNNWLAKWRCHRPVVSTAFSALQQFRHRNRIYACRPEQHCMSSGGQHPTNSPFTPFVQSDGVAVRESWARQLNTHQQVDAFCVRFEFDTRARHYLTHRLRQNRARIDTIRRSVVYAIGFVISIEYVNKHTKAKAFDSSTHQIFIR